MSMHTHVLSNHTYVHIHVLEFGGNLYADITEKIRASDSSSAYVTSPPPPVVETASPDTVQDSVKTNTASVSEPITSNDSQSGGILSNADITESATPDHSEVVDIGVNHIEYANATDEQSGEALGAPIVLRLYVSSNEEFFYQDLEVSYRVNGGQWIDWPHNVSMFSFDPTLVGILNVNNGDQIEFAIRNLAGANVSFGAAINNVPAPYQGLCGRQLPFLISSVGPDMSVILNAEAVAYALVECNIPQP